VFEHLRSGNSQLLPLFPYFGRGAIVPAGALFAGDAGSEWGHFFHCNSQDEIVVCFGSSGGMLRTGQILSTPNMHGVNSQLKDPHDPSSFIVVTVTQRQSVAATQRETKIFRCGRCHAHLLDHEFDATPRDESRDGPYAEFPTLTQGRVAVERLNSAEGLLHCRECGYDNPPFPLEAWGWGRWEERRRVVNRARRALDARAHDELGGLEVPGA
jgi:hypothetical protein